MKRIWIAITSMAALALLVAGAAAAAPKPATATPVGLGDVQIVFQPKPSGYQPDGTNYDLADQGKSFDILCRINEGGQVDDCQAPDNDLVDQNFVHIALSNVNQWVVAPQTVRGDSAVGRMLLVTVQFSRADRTDVAVAEGAR